MRFSFLLAKAFSLSRRLPSFLSSLFGLGRGRRGRKRPTRAGFNRLERMKATKGGRKSGKNVTTFRFSSLSLSLSLSPFSLSSRITVGCSRERREKRERERRNIPTFSVAIPTISDPLRPLVRVQRRRKFHGNICLASMFHHFVAHTNRALETVTCAVGCH